MKKYSVEGIQTTTRAVACTVEADSEEEALEKVDGGEGIGNLEYLDSPEFEYEWDKEAVEVEE